MTKESERVGKCNKLNGYMIKTHIYYSAYLLVNRERCLNVICLADYISLLTFVSSSPRIGRVTL